MIYSLFDKAFKLLSKTQTQGCFVEFGVYRGQSLELTIKMAQERLSDNKDRLVYYGFDTFKGLPSTDVPLLGAQKKNWAAGVFSDTSVDYVQKRINSLKIPANVKLIPGQFNQTRSLSKLGIDKIRFAHLDADIYEGYRDALTLITKHIQPGTVMIFDELMPPSDENDNQSVRLHGMKAVREWEEKTGINLHIICWQWSTTLCVVVDDNYLRKYGRFIESLRHENVIQTLQYTGFQLLQRFNK